MITKDDYLSIKDQSFKNNNFPINDHGNQYSNLNLNQNQKYLNFSPIQSNSKLNNDKFSESTVSDNREDKRKLQTCNKLSNSCLTTLSLNDKTEGVKKDWKKNDSLNSTKNSTLSLHIFAHESTTEANVFDDSFNENDKKVLIKGKSVFDSTIVNQNPFEFPRQQNDKISEPEMSQFIASQRLFNPNEALKSGQQANSSTFSTMIKIGDERTRDVFTTKTFEQLLIHPDIIPRIKKCGYQLPTPVQAGAIPLGLLGNDLLVQAKSGTGKTLVFAILVASAIKETRSNEVVAVIIAPVREIAYQIKDLIDKIADAGTRTCVFVGGEGVRDNKTEIAHGCSVAIGTPGRMAQLVRDGALSFKQSKLFVLDEADKLVESSFTEDIKIIYNALNPQTTQVTAFSATYPNNFDVYLSEFMKSPTAFRLDSDDVQLLGINQYAVVALDSNHVDVAIEMLPKMSYAQVIIFTNTSEKCAQISDTLIKHNFKVAAISGEFTQEERKKVFTDLKNFALRIMVSTDLSARGIDASNVNAVFNLGVPSNLETYLHRIGRAGRYGGNGASITILTSKQEISSFSKMAVSGNLNVKLLDIKNMFPYDLTYNDKYNTNCVGFVESCEKMAVETKADTRISEEPAPSKDSGGNHEQSAEAEDEATSNSTGKDNSDQVSFNKESLFKGDRARFTSGHNSSGFDQTSSNQASVTYGFVQPKANQGAVSTGFNRGRFTNGRGGGFVQTNSNQGANKAGGFGQSTSRPEPSGVVLSTYGKPDNSVGANQSKVGSSSAEPSTAQRFISTSNVKTDKFGFGRESAFGGNRKIFGNFDDRPFKPVLLADMPLSPKVPSVVAMTPSTTSDQPNAAPSLVKKAPDTTSDPSVSASVADKMASLKDKSFGKTMGVTFKTNLFTTSDNRQPAVINKAQNVEKDTSLLPSQSSSSDKIENLTENLEKIAVIETVDKTIKRYTRDEMNSIKALKSEEEWTYDQLTAASSLVKKVPDTTTDPSVSATVADNMAALKDKSFGKTMGVTFKPNLFTTSDDPQPSITSKAQNVEIDTPLLPSQSSSSDEIETLTQNLDKLAVVETVDKTIKRYTRDEMNSIKALKSDEEWTLYAKRNSNFETTDLPFVFDSELLRVPFEQQIRVLRKREEEKLIARQEELGIRKSKKLTKEQARQSLYPSSLVGMTDPVTSIPINDCNDLDSVVRKISDFVKNFSKENLHGSAVFPRTASKVSYTLQISQMLAKEDDEQDSIFAQRLGDVPDEIEQPAPNDSVVEENKEALEAVEHVEEEEEEEEEIDREISDDENLVNESCGNFYGTYANKLLTNFES